MKWFKHISDSGHDPDIGELLSIFGSDGYYMFFRTIEIMAREFDVENPGKNIFNFEFFLKEFRKISKKKLLDFLKITNKRKRIFFRIDNDDIHLNCPKLKDLCDEYTLKQITKMSGQAPDIVGTKTRKCPEQEEEEEKDKDKEKEKDLKTSCLKSMPSDIDIRLTQHLISLMHQNNPKSRIIKNLTEKRQLDWINSCRLMRERDGRTAEEIKAMIEFSQADSFWKSNIWSMPKLRDKFDQLWLKAKKEKYSGIKEWLKEKELEQKR